VLSAVVCEEWFLLRRHVEAGGVGHYQGYFFFMGFADPPQGREVGARSKKEEEGRLLMGAAAPYA
jgi:hypothetical protein